jgi:hypothetical protein
LIIPSGQTITIHVCSSRLLRGLRPAVVIYGVEEWDATGTKWVNSTWLKAYADIPITARHYYKVTLNTNVGDPLVVAAEEVDRPDKPKTENSNTTSSHDPSA